MIEAMIMVLIVILAACGFFGILFLLAMVHAFVLSKLWAWFVVPLFGLPELSIAYAYGLMLLITYVTKDTPKYKEDKVSTKEGIHGIVTSILKPLVTLGVGYFVKVNFL